MQNGLKSCIVFIEDAETKKAIASLSRYGPFRRTKELVGQVPLAWKTNIMIYYGEV